MNPSLSLDARERVFAAASQIFEESGRQTMPTVDQVRRLAKVDMHAATAAMREWRRQQTAQAAPKGNAEALRQKGRTRTTLRKVRLRTPKVQSAAMTRAGNLSGDQRRHKAQKGVLCLFFDA